MTRVIIGIMAGCLLASCGPRTEYAGTPAQEPGKSGESQADSTPPEGYERVTCFEGGRKIVDDYAKGYVRGGTGGHIGYDSATTNGTVSVGGSCVTVSVRTMKREGWTPLVPGYTDASGK